jgi:CelD/BcsL family acetyltransferase involved in cellulose biosynthesis
MSWKVDLEKGADALGTLRELEHQGSWQRLARADPKHTWFQEPLFVNTWYSAYERTYQPLVALGWRGADLVGLLALATRPDGQIVIAGANHAWYEGWIAEPELDAEFMAAAVDAVLAQQQPSSWRWKYLVRGADVSWVEKLEHAEGIVTEQTTPVWDLTLEDSIDRHLKPRMRNYMNRYRRDGDLTLRRLHGDEAIEALRIVAPWSDLRHGAVRADLPFRDDPEKLPLHERLASAGEGVHTSVLECGNRPLAVHQGAWDGHRMVTGLYGFDPTEARQSPGNILMIELARHVLELGGHEMDLTPGGEWWKNEFATRQESVYRVELFADSSRRRARQIGRGLATGAKAMLGRLGVEPDDVRRVADALRPAAPATPAEFEVFEIEVSGSLDSEPCPNDDWNGVDATWLHRMLAVDDVSERADTERFLSLSLRLLSRGWRPLVLDHDRAPGTILWAQPPGVPAVIPADPGQEPVMLVRNPAAAPEGVAIPEHAAIVLIGHDGGDPAVLVELLAMAQQLCAREKLWVGTAGLSAATATWLSSHGRAVELSRNAA